MSRLLVLASASPRRRELLARLGLPFVVVPSGADEDAPDGADPLDLARGLAVGKARAVWASRGPDACVLGADTVVAADDAGRRRVLGKPADPAEARAMLDLLSGATHTVYTGVALVTCGPGDRPLARSAVAATRVAFRALTEAELDAYLLTDEPWDKAGGYGVQGLASAFVESMEGDYYNVMGLPLTCVRLLLLPHYPAVLPAPAAPPLPFALRGGAPCEPGEPAPA